MRRLRAVRLGAGVALSVAMLAAMLAASPAWSVDWRRDWATLYNERHGFLLAYPINVFQQRSDPDTDEGRVLYSRDGKAQLLVGAFANDDAMTLEDYRDFLLDGQYAGADIDYAPLRKRWFVISGTISGTMGEREFYERVSFTCSGRIINSWAMIYPTEPKSENRFYDKVVEAIARTYTPGAGRSGNCD